MSFVKLISGAQSNFTGTRKTNKLLLLLKLFLSLWHVLKMYQMALMGS